MSQGTLATGTRPEALLLKGGVLLTYLLTNLALCLLLLALLLPCNCCTNTDLALPRAGKAAAQQQQQWWWWCTTSSRAVTARSTGSCENCISITHTCLCVPYNVTVTAVHPVLATTAARGGRQLVPVFLCAHMRMWLCS